MSRRLVNGVIAVMFSIGAVLMPVREVKAALPLLAVPAVEFAAGLVVSNVGRVVATQGAVAANDALWLAVAANDASWAVAGGSGLVGKLAAVLGIGAVVAAATNESGEVREYEIPLAPTEKIKPAPIVPSGDLGTYTNPLPFNHPGLKVTVPAGGTCHVSSSNSNDGNAYSVPEGVYDLDDLVAACKAALWHSQVDMGNGVTYYYFYDYGYDLSEPMGISSLLYKSTRYYYYMPRFYSVQASMGGSNPWTQKDMSAMYGTMTLFEPKDGSRRFVYSNGGYIADKTDPDFSADELQKFSVPSRLSFSGVDSAGRQTRLDVATSGDHAVISSATQLAADQVAYRSLEARGKQVTSVSEQVFTNTDIGTLLSSQPSLVPGSDSGAGAVSIDFPSDYARTGEANAAADKMISKLDSLTDISSASHADPDIPDQSKFEEAYFKSTFAPLLGWQLPAHASECPVADFTIDWWGNSQRYVMDAHCVIAEDNRSAISVAFIVSWVLLALFIILGA